MNKRENNYDLLRVICTVAIITIHVSSMYKKAITDEDIFGEIYTTHMMITLLYNTLSRFAVPCFVMLSGAFALADEKNMDYKYFYRKTIKKIYIPVLIFSVFYFCFSLAGVVALVVLQERETTLLLLPFKNIIKGEPYYHMWYLYMMAGVYLMVPILQKYKNELKKETFNRVAWIFLGIACLSLWTSTHELNWDIGVCACYLGYFMIGYVIRVGTMDYKNNRKGLELIVAGFIIELLVTFLQYKYSLQGISENDMKYGLIVPQNPLIVISSVFIFSGFSKIHIKKDFGKLSGNTFYIYLFHGAVWEILSRIIRNQVKDKIDHQILIPVCIAFVFEISYMLTYIYKKIWKTADEKFYISDRIFRLVGLEPD